MQKLTLSQFYVDCCFTMAGFEKRIYVNVVFVQAYQRIYGENETTVST